jgi:hypothetical protein
MVANESNQTREKKIMRLFQSAVPPALAFLLVACGGGSQVTAPATGAASVSAGAPAVVPLTVTVPEYLTLRGSSAVAGAEQAPDAAALAALASANRKLAVNQLSAALAEPGSNPASVPPLTYAALRALTAAASGDTLAQISASGFDVAPSSYIANLQTGRVNSQQWADKGRKFRTGFFAATDALAPSPRLATWAGSETDFATGGYATDSLLIKGLSNALVGLTPKLLPDPTKNIRLLIANSVSEQASWAAVTPFSGVFDQSVTRNDLLQMPMVRVTAGVKRFNGSDYTADVVAMPNGLQMMSLRPTAGSLPAYSGRRLEAALSEVLQGLLASGAAASAGEMVLPVMDINLPVNPAWPLLQAGISQPFDSVNANLRNLDGLGGVYASPFFAGAKLRVTHEGAALSAADVTAFAFSPLNTSGSGGAGNTNVTLPISTTFNLFTCTWPMPDLRSFFLAIVDSKGWVISLAAIQAVPGTVVTSARTFFNPWPNVPQLLVSPDMTGTLAIGSLPGQTVVDVVGQAAQFGFSKDPAGIYSHASCLK